MTQAEAADLTSGIASINGSLEMLNRLVASRKVVDLQGEALHRSVSLPGLALLRRLVAAGPMPIGELARAAQMDGGAAARTVTVLEADGLVRRTASETDGRSSIVMSTDAGADLAARVSALQQKHMLDSLADWSSEEVDSFADLLQRFVSCLRRTGFTPTKT